MSKWQPKLNDPSKRSEFQRLEREIISGKHNVERAEARIRKLTDDAVERARKIGFTVERILPLIAHGDKKLWLETRFGSPETGYGYCRLTRPEVWKRVQRQLQSPEGCTLKQALKIAVEKPKSKNQSRKEEFINKLTRKFSKMLQDWPEQALARLASDLQFMKEIRRLGKARNKEAFTILNSQIVKHDRQLQ